MLARIGTDDVHGPGGVPCVVAAAHNSTCSEREIGMRQRSNQQQQDYAPCGRYDMSNPCGLRDLTDGLGSECMHVQAMTGRGN